jgi:hypothetical protein
MASGSESKGELRRRSVWALGWGSRSPEFWQPPGNLLPAGNVTGIMKILCVAAAAALLACNLSGFGQTEVGCGQILDTPLHARASLTIDSRAAALEIAGTDKESIHVVCTADDMATAQHVKLRFSGTADSGDLTVTGHYGKNNNLRIRVEVPRKLNLRVSMDAGEVKVEEVAGDKDIRLYAGQITISSSREWDYRRIEASVVIGQVSAPPFGVDKGGFFRTFSRKDDNGEYRLDAHVLTGQIDLVHPDAHAFVKP